MPGARLPAWWRDARRRALAGIVDAAPRSAWKPAAACCCIPGWRWSKAVIRSRPHPRTPGVSGVGLGLPGTDPDVFAEELTQPRLPRSRADRRGRPAGHSFRLRRSRPSRLPHQILAVQALPARPPSARPESPRGPRHPPTPRAGTGVPLRPGWRRARWGETPPAAHVLDFVGGHVLRKTGTFVFGAAPRLPVQGPGWAVADRPARHLNPRAGPVQTPERHRKEVPVMTREMARLLISPPMPGLVCARLRPSPLSPSSFRCCYCHAAGGLPVHRHYPGRLVAAGQRQRNTSPAAAPRCWRRCVTRASSPAW